MKVIVGKTEKFSEKVQFYLEKVEKISQKACCKLPKLHFRLPTSQKSTFWQLPKHPFFRLRRARPYPYRSRQISVTDHDRCVVVGDRRTKKIFTL
jgi:uncharacterized protein YukJ